MPLLWSTFSGREAVIHGLHPGGKSARMFGGRVIKTVRGTKNGPVDTDPFSTTRNSHPTFMRFCIPTKSRSIPLETVAPELFLNGFGLPAGHLYSLARQIPCVVVWPPSDWIR